MASESWHEAFEKLSPQTRELHRALRSVIEELDAVDWYQQRLDATPDPALKAILVHNRDEEKEHASMLLEWLRRNDPAFAAAFDTYLFTEGDVTRLEEKASVPSEAGGPVTPERMFTVGSLKGG